jgi:hypothetical protein
MSDELKTQENVLPWPIIEKNIIISKPAEEKSQNPA